MATATAVNTEALQENKQDVCCGDNPTRTSNIDSGYAGKESNQRRQRRRPLRRLYCCVNALIMAVLVTVEIYAQIVIFL